MKREWKKVHTKAKAFQQLFDLAGVRHEERWKTEAEDEIVGNLLALRDFLNLSQIQALSRVLHCYRVLLSGEWVAESDHGTAEEAAARVHYLNGGKS